MRHFTCYDCKHEWDIPHGVPRPQECPKCGSTNIHSPGPHRYGGRGRRVPKGP
jgi:uncharacterized protein